MSFATTSTTAHGSRTGASAGELVDRFPTSRPVLLAAWAHPDDESYLGAGLMAEVARRGGTVVSVTATLGEHGTADPDREPPEKLAATRRQELDGALAALGVQQAFVLGYGDGACDDVPDALGAQRLGAVIEAVDPDVVLTFGPDGVTGHPDHQAVGRWTETALARRSRPVPLLTTAAGAAWPESCVDRMHEVGAFWPGYPDRAHSGEVLPVQLDGALLEQKLAALACHRSQIGPLQTVLGETGYRRLASVEAYVPANPSAVQMLSSRPVPVAA